MNNRKKADPVVMAEIAKLKERKNALLNDVRNTENWLLGQYGSNPGFRVIDTDSYRRVIDTDSYQKKLDELNAMKREASELSIQMDKLAIAELKKGRCLV